jgi:adenylate cyclase
MSKPFVEHLWGNPHSLGRYEVDGFDERVEVYRP